ncbi:hypothetical protein K2173_026232 [Erythroxylum novogranatense]|uniref:Retrotransposon Copia-like N-terminal domain-containing protein n=1 Tax=Erythroxylum novogranatense TaxID=1862640 RepID=A0AAV8SC17_9ROSI|nr:hypothetical protein K2173_026232 [Erythroxylum novogranatense]
MEGKKVIMSSSYNPSLQISPVKFDGTNYLTWSRSCLLFIKARGLQVYITDDSKRLDVNTSDYNQWESENSLVMSWLINSIKPEIARTYLLLDTATKIWKVASLTYSQIGNKAQIFYLRNKLHNTKQGDKTVSQYFAELCGLWQELDYYQDFQAKCSKDSARFQKMIEEDRVFDFLAGLHLEYDHIRGTILGKDHFPSVQLAHSLVQQEESRRNVMLHTLVMEKRGLVASSTKKAKPAYTSSNKDHLHCDYCGKSRHTWETCWKLHGRPNQSRGKRGGSVVRGQTHLADGTKVSETSLTGGLSNEELQALRQLLSKADSASTVGSSNLAKSGPSHRAEDWNW